MGNVWNSQFFAVQNFSVHFLTCYFMCFRSPDVTWIVTAGQGLVSCWNLARTNFQMQKPFGPFVVSREVFPWNGGPFPRTQSKSWGGGLNSFWFCCKYFSGCNQIPALQKSARRSYQSLGPHCLFWRIVPSSITMSPITIRGGWEIPRPVPLWKVGQWLIC